MYILLKFLVIFIFVVIFLVQFCIILARNGMFYIYQKYHFLSTLRLQLDVTCSCYFGSNVFSMDGECLDTLDN